MTTFDFELSLRMITQEHRKYCILRDYYEDTAVVNYHIHQVEFQLRELEVEICKMVGEYVREYKKLPVAEEVVIKIE